ncbi:hypothetical protein KBB89_01170 [Candidatus Gracilibacteria bacterium]|nr:hypothetical protein [Candidatus Gracilibacteria bacterium]
MDKQFSAGYLPGQSDESKKLLETVLKKDREIKIPNFESKKVKEKTKEILTPIFQLKEKDKEKGND